MPRAPSTLGNGPGLWDQVPGGLRRYGAVTLTAHRAHTHTDTHCMNSNGCQPNDKKVNQRKGLNRCCTYDVQMDKVSVCMCMCVRERERE